MFRLSRIDIQAIAATPSGISPASQNSQMAPANSGSAVKASSNSWANMR